MELVGALLVVGEEADRVVEPERERGHQEEAQRKLRVTSGMHETSSQPWQSAGGGTRSRVKAREISSRLVPISAIVTKTTNQRLGLRIFSFEGLSMACSGMVPQRANERKGCARQGSGPGPSNTTFPPSAPAPGPMSMIQSARATEGPRLVASALRSSMPSQTRAKSERSSRIEPLTRLATGGMADIWLAREVGAAGLERFVVVKRLLPHLAREPEIVDMFVSEARFVARLVHPNVVQIHDLGEDDEGYFLVMEYVAGCSASELLTAAAQAHTRLPLGAALCIAEQACQGAHAAHELRDPTGEPLGLVHRDISPHNLMVGPSGEVKLLDFGIAKATEAAEATRTGSLKGKHGYMSPEQCAASHVDRRSDVFALGIVCWELFTGARLFKRETEYATMHSIVSGDVRSASALRPEVPAALDDVLRKALAHDLAERFQTADAFRRALLAAAEEAGIRPSRDALVATMTELLGDKLSERERALREAAKAGHLPEPTALRAALVQTDSSTPGPRGGTPDGVATVVQRRPPHLPDEPPADDLHLPDEPRTVAATTGTSSSSSNRDATLIDARPLQKAAVVEPPEADAAAAVVEPPEADGAAAAPPASPIASPVAGATTTADGDAVATSAEQARGTSRRLWRAVASAVVAVVVAVVVILAARRGRETTSTPPLGAGSGAPLSAPAGPPLRLVVAPTVDAAVIRSELAPFLRWLGATLDRPVDLVIADSYDQTGQMVSEGRADFALVPPLLFVRALASEPRLQPLAVRLFDGSRASDGYLLVRDEGSLSMASDLRGHSICYVDRASTTGYLLPRIWMRKAGLVPDTDVKAVMSGDHVAAMRDLAAGKCDAAAVYSGAYLTARQQGIAVGRLRVLAVTGRVPQDALVAAPGMPEAEMKALRAALLRFEPQRDIDAGRIGDVLGITGFAEFRTAEFDAIREAAEREGLVPRPGAPPHE
jgi:serine/threonine-protein kinase